MLRVTAFMSTAKTTRNYYDVLGVKANATPIEIKTSFYKLVKQHHPDHNQNQSQEAMQRFHQLRQAFEVLSDSHRRRLYDSSFGSTEKTQREANKKYTQRNETHEESDAFNEEDSYFRRSYWSMRRPVQGEDIYETVKVSLLDAVKGVVKVVRLQRKAVCRECERSRLEKCFTCGGKGKLHLRRQKSEGVCSRCNGVGFFNHCSCCHGSGFVTESAEEQIDVPKGVLSQTVLRKEKAGHQGFRSKNGDLYVKVDVEQHHEFAVEGSLVSYSGNNIRTTRFVPISVAVLGGRLQINTLYGKVEIKVPAGVQSGDEKRLANLGLSSMFSKQKGDHIVTFRVNVPLPHEIQDISLYEALRTTEAGSPP